MTLLEKKNREELAREILAYFLRNPHCVDDLKGIAGWRLLDEMIHRAVHDTSEAVEWLVAKGYLDADAPTGADRIFRLNEEKRDEAQDFVEGTNRRTDLFDTIQERTMKPTDETPGQELTSSEETMPENQPDTTTADAEDANADGNPADTLKELQERLKKQEEDLAKLTKERDALKADVDSLAKGVGEIDKAKAGFTKALPQLTDERRKLDKYKTDTLTATEVLLGPKKDQVDTKIQEVEKKISNKKSDVEKTRELVRATAAAADAAQADLEQKQKNYDEFKNLEKGIGEKLKKLGEIKTKIDKLNDTPKAASMYVLLQEMKSVLGVTEIPNENDFEAELGKRLKDLQEAKEAALTAKQAAAAARAKLTSEETALAALEKSRVDDLLAATDEFNQ